MAKTTKRVNKPDATVAALARTNRQVRLLATSLDLMQVEVENLKARVGALEQAVYFPIRLESTGAPEQGLPAVPVGTQDDGPVS